MSEALDLGALDSIIAQDISSIADLPDFKNPPAGFYALLIESVKVKEIADKTALAITYVVDTVIELADPDTEERLQVVPGNKFNEAFFFDKQEYIDLTLGALKKKFAGLSEPLGTTNLKEILSGMVGMKINCVIKTRVNKKVTPNELYSSVNDVTLAAA